MTTTGKRMRPLVKGLGFVDGLRWHDGALWCSDLFSRRVLSVDGGGRVSVRGYVPGQPCGIGFLLDGSVIVASTHSREIVQLLEGSVRVVTSTAAAFPGPINDLATDRTGRAWVSPLVTPGADPTGSPLIVLDRALTPRCLDVQLAAPNGLVVTDHGRTLLVAETGGHCLTAFDIEADGGLGRRRTFADLGEWAPDGICVDAEGAVWVGCPFAECFARVKEGGHVLDVVEVPGRWAVAPVLGGSDGDVLFGATARTDLRRFRRGVGTAAIETCTVDVPGQQNGGDR